MNDDKLQTLISQRDDDGYTALHCAAYSNSFDVAVLLVQNGASVNALTEDGWTPLHSASRWNSDSVAGLLLSQGADVNAETNGKLTPIQLAASEKSSMKVIEILLAEPNCNVNCVNGAGDNAIELAARSSGVDSALTARDQRLFYI